MDKKLLYFVRSLFLNFNCYSKERSFTPGLRMLCLGMFFVVSFSTAATITSTATGGNWNAPSTWLGGAIPGTGDTVIIATTGSGSVNINATLTQLAAGSVTVNSGAILTTGAGNITLGALTVNNGGTFTCSRNLNILGATTISGTINFQTTIRSNTFSGNITLNNTAVWNETVANTLNIVGNFINNASTFTASSGVYTFSGTTKNISGTTPTIIPSISITGSYTNNGSLSASSALSGTGSLTNLGTLNIGGSSGITTLNATASGNTVNYTGTGTQTVKTTDYYNLGSSGGGTKTVGGNITVNKDFSLAGGTFVLNNNTSSTLNILGDYNQTGGVFDFNAGTSGTSTLNLKGNFTNTAGVNSFTTVGVVKNGILNFTGTGIQTLSMPTAGAGTFVKYFVDAASTLKIDSDFTLSTALVSDTDPWMGELNVSGTVDLGLFKVYPSGGRGSSGTAKFVLNSGATFITANSGGVDGSVPVSSDMVRTLNSGANYTFNGTIAQITSTGMPATVNNLTISNTHTSGVTLSRGTTVSKNFSVATGSIANLGTSLTHNTSTLTLGGAVMIPGSWGSTGSTALNTNNTFFIASASGIINNTCTSPVITAHPQPLTICEGAGGTFSVTSSTPGVSYQWQYSLDSTNWFNIDAALGASVTGYTTNTLSLNATPVGWNGYRVRCVVRNNLCAANSSSAVLTVNFLPTVKTVAVESLTVCSGSGTNVTVSASQTGVSYQLRNASNIAIGSVVAGNGGTINLATGNLSATTTFNVLATNSSSASCSLQMGNTVTVTVNTNNLGTQVGTTSTFCTDNLTTYTTPVATPGQFALVNVIKGFKYNFSVGDAFSAGSEVLTILDASSNANVSPAATNNGATGTAITDWVSSISGQIKVVLTTLNCAVNNTVAGTSGITVTQTATGNNLDIQTTAGANTWVGHIYNAGGARPTPFNNANYAGYYTIGTTNFNENFGANNACIPVFSNGTQRASMYAEGFAVRYRMTYTNTPGCYLVKITGDDGVRLSIDGGSNYIFNFWDEQGATTYDYIVVNLSGTTNFVLDYYENGGENRVSFDIIPFNPALNIITAPTTINFCNGGDPAVIGGSMQYTSADVNQANPYINFQWQLSTNGGVSFNNIPSATTRTYDPPAYAANGGATDLVYQYKRLAIVNTTNVSGATCAFSESNVVTITNYRSSVGGTTSAAQSICTGTQPANITLSGNVGAVTKWQKTTDPTFTTGITDITGTTTTLAGTTIGNLTTTTYFRAVVQSGNCAVANSSIATITVNPVTVAGTIASSANSHCLGTNATTFTLSGNIGSVLRWESSTDNFVSLITPITNTTSTLTVNNLTTTTYYRAVVQSGSCSTLYSNILRVATGSPTATAATLPLCNGFTANWTKVLGATGYLLDVSTSNGFASFVSGYNAKPILDTDASSLVTGLLPNTTYYYRISPTYACGVYAIPSNTISITTASLAPIAAIAGGSATVCIGSSTPAFTNTTPGGLWSVTSGTGTASITGGVVTGLTAGTVTVEYTVPSGGCSNKASISLTVNPTPTAPSASVITLPTCAVPTGVITVSSPAEGNGFTYSINGTDYYTTAVFTGVAPSVIPYSVTTKNAAGCTSPATSVTVNDPSGKVWNGSSNSNWSNPQNWTPNIVPGPTDCVVIPTTVAQPEIAVNSNVEIYSLTVASGGLLTVNSKAILTVNRGITVDTGGNLVFEDDSSLLQKSTDNTINSGNITYKRITAKVSRYDFTFWSTPVKRSSPEYRLVDVSPLTLADKYYSYIPGTGWKISYNGILPMEPGMGYIVRAPQNYDIAKALAKTYEASFIGTPNNGTIEITPVKDKNILVGNPYPSALDAKKFIKDNQDIRNVQVGSLYFWTHNSPPSASVPGDYKYNYTTSDYAVYNLTGGTTTHGATTYGNNDEPSGYIAAGAAFFIKPDSNNKIAFTNDMRVGTDNEQFYKTAKTKDDGKNRLWLNMSNEQGAFKQVLIGYLDGATNNWDNNYDGATLDGNTYADFYSINETDKLTIQGRALPFSDADMIPLGYVSSIVGDFTIAIDKGDGLFDTQAVYLEDKKTGKTVDLRAANYTFTAEKGTFEDRFVLHYTNKTLGTGDFENIENGLLVSVKDKAVKVTSAKEPIKEVTIFDINGKLIYDKKKVGSTELQISNLQAANQVLLVKVVLENGFTTTIKIVFQ